LFLSKVLHVLSGADYLSYFQMAKAGFVHCQDENEPDVVKCFICYKTLDGWEPDDDPWWVFNTEKVHLLSLAVFLLF
jgi:hypothetical protein